MKFCKQKQPDAFEMAVEKYVFGDCDDVLKRDAAKLLRAHHRKVVRMVERTHNITVGQFRKSILAKLKKMEGKS